YDLLPLSLTPTPPPALYTLSLHDALPISRVAVSRGGTVAKIAATRGGSVARVAVKRGAPYTIQLARATAQISLIRAFPLLIARRSEEHTSELQSRGHLVCRLLLEKKKHHK